ncbi:lipopolysaccharide biosynthesis protein [Methylobacterium sp. sgz302541]|uniref:lipopolysaccharide biosynthesis protein n=1 Tax=unclassified Methylobacterium TaxID=2615210 RepID=UPI003D3476A6
MLARHTVTYVGSRAFAAALNLGSVAVFTRLAPLESYGTYLYIFSWALVVYGATCQWPKFAFFALYDEARGSGQVDTVVRILCGTLALAALACGLAVALGFAAPRTAFAIVAAAAGMTVFEGATEIARTRLSAGPVAASVVARGILVLVLGSASLKLTGDPVHLALAVAAANILAAIPAARVVAPMMGGKPSLAEARRLLAYGWPLVLSFGIAALAQTIDRLVIGKTIGAEDLGAYGAIADFLKQSFLVFGESIAFSMISIAKRDARAGGMAAAEGVLNDAARTLTLIAAFGTVFFLSFDDVVVGILLGPAYRAQALALAPILIAASVIMMFRAYYFGQVIYFTRTSHLDAVVSLVMLLTVGALSLALIPHLGVTGAAVAFACGQAAGCAVFIAGSRIGPGRAGPRMPLPVADLLGIVACALACAGLMAALGMLPGGSAPMVRAVKFVLLVAGFAAAAWRFNLAGIADGIRAARKAA